MVVKLKVKPLDIEAGGEYIVVLNEAEANELGIIAGDRIKITKDDKELIGIVDTSDKSIKRNEIGIFEEIEREYGLKSGETVTIKRLEKTESPSFIKDKLDGKTLSYEKIRTIIEDVVKHRLSEAEISAFAISTYTRDFTMKEIANLTKAVVEAGEQLEWDTTPICNKHCLGGVPGNRTTPIIIPIIAAAGLTIPKTSSRAITSPAGTADTVEVLADVNFKAKEIKEIVQKTNGCLVWGGGMNMAPADSEFIKVLNPLKLDPPPLTLTSIMAKKKSSGTTHLIIDIPFGKRTKVENKKQATSLAQKFKKIGNMMDIKTKVVLTHGSEPIGKGIGPLLEARDVLKVLEQKEDRPLDLEQKSLQLAGELLELGGVESGQKKAKKILKSQKALEKFKEIITAQNGDPTITSKDLTPAEYTKIIRAEKNATIEHIDNIYISEIARRLGCPGLKSTGVYLHEHKGVEIEKEDKLLTLYAKNKEDLKDASNYLNNHFPFKLSE